jgi:hypothetical protein
MVTAKKSSYLARRMTMVDVKRPVGGSFPTNVTTTILLGEHTVVLFDTNTVRPYARDALLFVSFISVSRHT